MKKKQRHEATQDTVFAPNGIASDAIRKFHKQCLEKALQSIEEQSIEERFLSTSMIPVNKSEMPAAKKSIQAFQKKFMKKFEANPKLDQVVCLSVQLFNVSKSLNEEQ